MGLFLYVPFDPPVKARGIYYTVAEIISSSPLLLRVLGNTSYFLLTIIIRNSKSYNFY